MATLDGMVHWHPQTAYAVLQKSLQQEWAFVQHVTSGIGMAFQPVEDELRYTFFSDLFQKATSQIPRRVITVMPFKQTEMELPNPTQTTGDNLTASFFIIGHLFAALRGRSEFRSGYHALLMGEGREEI